jgi:hypothetical protein
MPELPRLDDLVGLSYPAADNAHRVFKAYPGDWSGQEKTDKLKGFSLPAVASLRFKEASAANCQVRAWRMADHQVPLLDDAGTEQMAHVTLIMKPWRFRRQNVA